MLSKTAWFKILIVKIQNLRVLDRFKAQDRFKASKGTTRKNHLMKLQIVHKISNQQHQIASSTTHPPTAEKKEQLLLY